MTVAEMQKLIDEKIKIVADARALLDKAETQKRRKTPTENNRFDRWLSRVDDIDAELAEHEEGERRVATVVAGEAVGGRAGRLQAAEAVLAAPGERLVKPEPDDWNPRSAGNDNIILTPEQRMATGSGEHRVSPGALVQASFTDAKGHLNQEERALLLSGSASGGSYLLGPEQAGWLIDKARAKSVCVAAGCGSIPMERETLIVPKLLTDPVATWRHQGTTSTEDTTMTFGSITATARTLCCIVSTSIELLEDSPLASQSIDAALSAAMAGQLDFAMLEGAGAEAEPAGLLYRDDVVERDLAHASLELTDLSDAFGDVLAGDFTPNGIILSDACAIYLDKEMDGNNLWRKLSPLVEPLPRLTSTKITSTLGGANNETRLYMGQWDQAMFAIRTDIRLEAFRSGSTASTNAVSDMAVLIRAYLRADTIVLNEDAFVRVIGAKLA